jgi:hypothetical protein
MTTVHANPGIPADVFVQALRAHDAWDSPAVRAALVGLPPDALQAEDFARLFAALHAAHTMVAAQLRDLLADAMAKAPAPVQGGLPYPYKFGHNGVTP